MARAARTSKRGPANEINLVCIKKPGATGALSGTATDAFGTGGNTADFDGWIAYDASGQARK